MSLNIALSKISNVLFQPTNLDQICEFLFPLLAFWKKGIPRSKFLVFLIYQTLCVIGRNKIPVYLVFSGCGLVHFHKPGKMISQYESLYEKQTWFADKMLKWIGYSDCCDSQALALREFENLIELSITFTVCIKDFDEWCLFLVLLSGNFYWLIKSQECLSVPVLNLQTLVPHLKGKLFSEILSKENSMFKI